MENEKSKNFPVISKLRVYLGMDFIHTVIGVREIIKDP